MATHGRDGGSTAGTLFFGGLLLLVSLGFIGVSLYVATSSRSGGPMMTMVSLLGGGVLGGTGLYVVYGGLTGSNEQEDPQRR
jgi:hypothetical protein